MFILYLPIVILGIVTISAIIGIILDWRNNMRKKQEFEENNIINFGEGCWGMNISFLDDGNTNWKKQTRISGHYPYRSKIKKGTLLIKKCSLGYLYLRVKKIEYCRDPDDMFFANVIYICNDKMLSKEEHKYLEDNNLYNYCN